MRYCVAYGTSRSALALPAVLTRRHIVASLLPPRVPVRVDGRLSHAFVALVEQLVLLAGWEVSSRAICRMRLLTIADLGAMPARSDPQYTYGALSTEPISTRKGKTRPALDMREGGLRMAQEGEDKDVEEAEDAMRTGACGM
ncbi:hypothetical protein FB107DRAFT_274576 [Schizophyllum commune]